jgi:4-hydroxybenzoate polyprenyltransferase
MPDTHPRADAPLARRLMAWMHERFPPANTVAAVLVWAVALAWGRALASSGPVPVHAGDTAGALAAVGFFLMLRVFDEHKDYEADRITHPGRVLQRGLVTLAHLRLVGAVAIAAQVGASLAADRGAGPVTGAWIVTFVWTLLMAREFFAAEWIRPRLLLYALSHMLAMPLAVHWLLRMATGGAPLASGAWLYPAVSFATGSAFEIARKLKAPEDERPGVDSYTRTLGVRSAPVVLLALLAVSLAGFAAMLSAVVDGGLFVGGAGVLAAALIPGAAACHRFRARPDSAGARACETAAGVAIAAGHLVVLIVVVLARGVERG